MLKQKALWLSISLAIIVLDQLTKSIAVAELIEGLPRDFLPFFNFTLLYNKGAAFSFLNDAGGWQRWFFAAIAFVVSVVIFVWILKLDRAKKWELTGLAFILGGAVGNLWDRIALGKVVDFVDWFYPATDACVMLFYRRVDVVPNSLSCHWPAFNIADAAILIGAVCLIVDAFFIKEQSEK